MSTIMETTPGFCRVSHERTFARERERQQLFPVPSLTRRISSGCHVQRNRSEQRLQKREGNQNERRRSRKTVCCSLLLHRTYADVDLQCRCFRLQPVHSSSHSLLPIRLLCQKFSQAANTHRDSRRPADPVIPFQFPSICV